jgi:hypothetical protein
MRLMAIDYLTQSDIKADTLQKIITNASAPQNPAIMIKVKDFKRNKEKQEVFEKGIKQ